MSKYWSNLAKSLVPYVPGEQPRDQKYIKLNTNENPYPPSPKVLAAIRAAAQDELRLYPDPTCRELRQIVADYYDLHESQVFVGNGSDEILSFAFAAYFNPGKEILFPDITYSFYEVYANFYGLNDIQVPLDEHFQIQLDPFLQANGGIVLPNPNAPTAIAAPLDTIRSILEHNQEHVVIIDEAYIDFGGESAVPLIAEYSNLLVVHTLSKSRSLAGLRVGIAMGSEELMEGLERVKNSFNSYTLDHLALAGAIAAFQDEPYFQEMREKVIQVRDKTIGQLREIGCTVLDSKANFVYISHPNLSAKWMQEQLRAQGILVRHFLMPRTEQFLRVSIGTEEEMERFVQAYGVILKQNIGSTL